MWPGRTFIESRSMLRTRSGTCAFSRLPRRALNLGYTPRVARQIRPPTLNSRSPHSIAKSSPWRSLASSVQPGEVEQAIVARCTDPFTAVRFSAVRSAIVTGATAPALLKRLDDIEAAAAGLKCRARATAQCVRRCYCCVWIVRRV